MSIIKQLIIKLKPEGLRLLLILIQGKDLNNNTLDGFESMTINLGDIHQTSDFAGFITLIIMIMCSLILTFYEHATAVTRVFGLLFVSFFVCLLWIFQTSFIFIYLVYILAFISAVLMLFLSVVLMLPISIKT